MFAEKLLCAQRHGQVQTETWARRAPKLCLVLTLVCLVIASWHLDCSQTNLLTWSGVSLLYMAPFLLLISTDCFCYHLIDGSCIKLMLLCSTTLLFHLPFLPLPPLCSSSNLSFSHFSFLLFQTLCLQYPPLSLLFVFILYYQPDCFSECSAPSAASAQFLTACAPCEAARGTFWVSSQLFPVPSRCETPFQQQMRECCVSRTTLALRWWQRDSSLG